MSKKNNVEKRKLKMQEKKKKTQKMVGLIVVFVAIISIVAVAAVSLNNNDEITQKEIKETTENSDKSTDLINIPLSDISESASFYTYDANGVDLTYFIVKDSSSDIHAAFDACDVCYEAKKGYVQDGDVMKCVNCGLTFPIREIGESNTGGGCWPSYLPITIEDESILIEKSDIVSKKFMFQ